MFSFKTSCFLIRSVLCHIQFTDSLCNDQRDRTVTCGVAHCLHHVKQSVDAHDQGNGCERNPDLLQQHHNDRKVCTGDKSGTVLV